MSDERDPGREPPELDGDSATGSSPEEVDGGEPGQSRTGPDGLPIPKEVEPGPAASSGPAPDKKRKKKKKKKKRKELGAGRGVETMFRTSYRTHLDLSSLADTKANIMISINGIMISILLATIYPSIAANQLLLVPSTVLLLGCLSSLVFAVVAARPRVTRRKVTLEDVRENRANILFFGTFVNLSEEDFLTGMWELMDDRKRTYTNMMRDLYGLGSVLETKYRLLRVSYTIFMIGLVAGVLLFLVVYRMAGGQAPGI